MINFNNVKIVNINFILLIYILINYNLRFFFYKKNINFIFK